MERRAGRVAVKAPVHLLINSVCLIHIPSQRGISAENHQPFNWRLLHRDCKALKVVLSHLKYMMCLNRPPSMQSLANPGVHNVCISSLIWFISFLLQVVSFLILLDIVLFYLHFNIICSTSQTWMQRKCVEINSKSPCSHIWDANLMCFYVALPDQISSAAAPLLQLGTLTKVKREPLVRSVVFSPSGMSLCVWFLISLISFVWFLCLMENIRFVWIRYVSVKTKPTFRKIG